MKKFCKDLKKRAMKMINYENFFTINKQRVQMIIKLLKS